ncbi:MAG: glycosyltransferase [Sulfurimonas sp.]|jgi:glycosyltransferase involved in cell wall biosynthesis
MNILVLASSNASYNSVRPEMEIYISLFKMGYNIVIMTELHSAYTPKFKETGIKIIDASYEKKISFSLIKNIRNAIKEHEIDIVYATNSKAIFNAIFGCIGTKVKLITYRGTTGGLYRHDPSSYFNALNPRVNGIICVSESVTKHVKKQVFSNSKKIITIYKGHDICWYDQFEANLEAFGTNKNNFNIAFVANVRPHKGLMYVLKAAYELADIKDFHILLIGDKIDKEPYMSEIEKSGMKERIHITGFRNDVPSIVRSCDVLIHASTRKEGLPRIILESLASGTPVIASANESSLEIIEDGLNGFIVPIKDAKAIAEKIRYLHDSKELLEFLSIHTKDVIESKLSHKETVTKHDEYFKSIYSNTV